MKFKTMTAILSMICTQLLMAHDLPITLSPKIDAKKYAVIEMALNEVADLLPAKLKTGLPAKIELRFEKLSDHPFIPNDICLIKNDNSKNIRPFVYGEYHHRKNVLILNNAILNELARGRANSEKINCQHKSLYDQAIATIVHELTHAYDSNNGTISNSVEFIKRAGFKKGLLKTKNKNTEAMRPADAYELTSLAEAYAVNMEYFSMDSEFACRKPAMFEYLKNVFEADPFPNRKCLTSQMVMMAGTSGSSITKIDPKRVYRIDYLMASPGAELSSGFGHSMFRIVLCAPERYDVITNRVIKATDFGPKCLDDRFYHLVVSYRANVEGASLNYLKGVFGGYPSLLYILNFSDVLDEYNRDELRDVVSYPLRLSAKEKNDFINKVLEEHWNYRGNYKFVTNNCAVESFDLLKNALASADLEKIRSVTPKGVLEDLDRLEFLSLKSDRSEIFKARTEDLILAYQETYAEKRSGLTKEKVIKFIAKSSSSKRLEIFKGFQVTKNGKTDLHTEVSLLKKRLVKAASFSVLEQQILRSKSSELRKKAAELFAEIQKNNKKNNDEKIKKIIEENSELFKQSISSLAIAGYGVPLLSELPSNADLEEKNSQYKDVMTNIEVLLREFLPKEIEELESINTNIEIFNKLSLDARKTYRQKLDIYIQQVLTNLSYEDRGNGEGQALLVSALTSNDDLNKVRELLDIKLVSQKELLDAKLRKLIEQTLN